MKLFGNRSMFLGLVIYLQKSSEKLLPREEVRYSAYMIFSLITMGRHCAITPNSIMNWQKLYNV